MQQINTDIAIVGGGIAGLWLLARLKQQGYHAILIEQKALGAGQTMRSQGIIHSGFKYVFHKNFRDPSIAALKKLSARWQACFAGTGEVDLRQVSFLSKHYYICTTGNWRANFLLEASRFLFKNHTQKIATKKYPEALQALHFKGRLCQVEEPVVAVDTLLRALSAPYQEALVKIVGCVPVAGNGGVASLCLTMTTGEQVSLIARRYIFAAGEGNALLMQALGIPVFMQRRPLHMVTAVGKQLLPVFIHWIDKGTGPRLTITSHSNEAGEVVWYLGGSISESGVIREPAEQTAFAQSELRALFPHLSQENLEWHTFRIDRAEMQQPDGKRPSYATIKAEGNIIWAWPTKLAFAPLLSDEIVAHLPPPYISTHYHSDPFAAFPKPLIQDYTWFRTHV